MKFMKLYKHLRKSYSREIKAYWHEFIILMHQQQSYKFRFMIFYSILYISLHTMVEVDCS